MGINLLLALAIGTTPLTEAALRSHYAHLATLSADISQTKTGRYWARPMRSQIRLEWTPERIVWKTISPVRSTVSIVDDALTLTDSLGSVKTMEGSADPRFQSLISLLRAFLVLDLPRIERDFVLEYSGHDLVARVRADASVTVFRSITFHFDDELGIQAIDLDAESEQTHLTFRNVVRAPALPR